MKLLNDLNGLMSSKRLKNIKRTLLFFSILIYLSSCGSGDNDKAEDVLEESAIEEEVVEATIDKDVKNPDILIGNDIPNVPLKANNAYQVILSADSIFTINQNGLLRIWIGENTIHYEESKEMVTDQTTIPSHIGNYAKITPFAPDFEIMNYDINKCHLIDSTGSSVLIALKPSEIGKFDIAATIEFFKDSLCSGSFVSKTSKFLTVEVTVNPAVKSINRKKKTAELIEIFWEKFLTFWGALITLILGTLFFLIKNIIKKRTNYEEKDEKEKN